MMLSTEVLTTMGPKRPVFFAFLFLIGPFGCDNPTAVENPQQMLFVQAFLSPDREVEVMLRQTLPPDRFYEGLEDSVRDAEVEIAVDGETFALAEDADSPGTYRISANVLLVESGKTYQLTATSGENRVRAATTVPFKTEITEVSSDTLTYFQDFGEQFGDLAHPGEFRWTKSENVGGYVIVVEAIEVRSLPISFEPLTAELDTLLALRVRLPGEVSDDSLAALDVQIDRIRTLFEEGVSRVTATGDTLRYLRDRHEENWQEIETNDWTEGQKWRERRSNLDRDRFINYWIPADSLRSDFWWLGVRFEGVYEIKLQAVDQNYFDYFSTRINGFSGNDADPGPLFHVEGGTGVFGSYAEDSRRILVERAKGLPALKLLPRGFVDRPRSAPVPK